VALEALLHQPSPSVQFDPLQKQPPTHRQHAHAEPVMYKQGPYKHDPAHIIPAERTQQHAHTFPLYTNRPPPVEQTIGEEIQQLLQKTPQLLIDVWLTLLVASRQIHPLAVVSMI
jgi:hypothetical protein